MTFTPKEREIMIAVARDAIRAELDTQPFDLQLHRYPVSLRALRATFVTLLRDNQLRGCIGSLEAHRPLLADIADNARSAAFNDPRFRTIEPHEFAALNVHISVLNPAEPIHASSETELIRQLRPGIDGVVLFAGERRGTFLPEVWKSLPDPLEFVRQLKRKIGLAPEYWSSNLCWSRYTSESISSEDGPLQATR